jgi:hypothetical protein
MKYIILTLALIILNGCYDNKNIQLDFSNKVIVCENKYDKKDDLIYYANKKSEFVSQTTGVLQYIFIDVYEDRKMINEYEMENYICYEITEQNQFEKIIGD